MTKTTKISLFALLFLLLLAGAAFFLVHRIFDMDPPPAPQSSPGLGAFYGQVTAAGSSLLPGATPIRGARVELDPGGYAARTDKEGAYYLIDMEPGTYTATISAPGYEDQVIGQLRAIPGHPQLVESSLFPTPQEPARARLVLTTAMGMGRPPEQYPYRSTVYLDAGKSENASREGFRWEIYGPGGELIEDPFEPGLPLTPVPSQMPGASPYVFTFIPETAGEYTVRLYLNNNLYPQEDMVEITVSTVNTAPEAFPSVYPGPLPPQKTGGSGLNVSSGLKVAEAGEPVYLRGFAVDKNFPSPELYNPGGNSADIYGKNNDHYQRAFSWRWELTLTSDSGSKDVTEWLQTPAGGKSSREQHLFFTARETGTYRATLVVLDNDPHGALESDPASVEILVFGTAATTGERTCLQCHGESGKKAALPAPWESTSHGRTELAGCESCHGPGKAHTTAASRTEQLKTIDTSHQAGTCGRCHDQYGQWEKSLHADGYAFGAAEIAGPLMLNCAKCHYPQGFISAVETAAAEGISFGQVEFKKPLFPGGPVFFDFAMLPEPDGKSISCTACHDPHTAVTPTNPTGLRLGGEKNLCGSCHQDKWHNVILEGTAGAVSAHEYPGSDYTVTNPHNTDQKCVLCHMHTGEPEGVSGESREVGGHTLRMRSLGTAEILGGYGPRPDNPLLLRGGEISGNILNLAPCRECHSDIATFNYNNYQAEIFALWTELGDLLRQKNGGTLPDYKPGDKCATCHRGGTLPFKNDPDLTLENAYTNYKLIGNDRSWGLHNPRYIRQLLLDSIESLK